MGAVVVLCPFCFEAFNTLNDLKEHRAKEHEQPTPQLEPVNTLVDLADSAPCEVFVKQRRTKRERTHQCTLCPRRYTNLSILRFHMDCKHNVKLTPEPALKSVVTEIKDVPLIEVQAPEDAGVASGASKHKFKCDLCEVRYTTRTNRRKHMLRAHDVTLLLHQEQQVSGFKFKCKCSEKFSDVTVLKQHLQTCHPLPHSKESPPRQQLREATAQQEMTSAPARKVKGRGGSASTKTSRKASRKKKFIIRNPRNSGRFECSICSKRFVQHSSLLRHKRIFHS